MNRAVYSAPDKLIFDVQGVIIELKKEFFTHKLPLNDDETLVHKLCVRLENILRYGAREKYTFTGTRKDYWNYINDCIPKDETVKFVQSISDIKTYLGKGRAFLRQALMEKSLADTLQRCSIKERLTKEFYVTDSIFRNEQLFQTLVHSLYDLNAVDFQLPHKGYDLDKSFPSFARKSFDSRASRSSISSTMSEQELPADPVLLLNKNVIELSDTVNSWLGKENEITNTLQNPSLQGTIDRVIILNGDILKLKSRNLNEIEILNNTIENLKKDKTKSDTENELRIKQLNERFSTLQKLDTSVTTDKFKELYDKLVATELELTESKAKCSLLVQDVALSKQQVDDHKDDYENLKSESNDLKIKFDQIKAELDQLKHIGHSSECTNKILESKLAELQNVNTTLKAEQKQTKEHLLEKDSMLKVKENELISLQESFETSTGLVVGSFKELQGELHNQLKAKSEVVHNVSSVNDDLSNESKLLQREKVDLENQKTELEEQMNNEVKKKEEAEKIITKLKLLVTDEKKKQSDYAQFVHDVSNVVEMSEGEDLDSEDGFLKKKKKKSKVGANDGELPKISPFDERESALRRVIEMQQELLDLKAEKKETEKEIVGLKYELNSISKNFEKLQNTSQGKNVEKTALEKKCEALEKEICKLNLEVDKYNGEIFTMSLDVSKLNEKMIEKEAECKKANDVLNELQMIHNQLNNDHAELKEIREKSSSDLQKLTENNRELSSKLQNLVSENHALTGQLESTEALQSKATEEIELIKKEMESTIGLKNEELQSLKFQLSTEEMKKEAAIKEAEDLKLLKEDLLTEMSETDEKIKALRNEQTEHDTTLGVENEQLADENTKLHKQFVEMKEKYDVAEKEITFLKVEVAKLVKEKEEEKAIRINGWNRLNNVIEEKKEMEQKYHSKIEQLTEDIDELKSHLVNMTKDKHELWTKKDDLEFNLKQKADERWVNDEEVNECTNCKQAFSITLRKHHCRLCGHIFCNNCSNRWLKTPHSKKKVRACAVCSDMYTDIHGGGDMIDGSIASGGNGSESVDGSVDNDDLLSSSEQINDESFDNYRKNRLEQDSSSKSDELATDPFEILGPADVTSSGSFGPSEQIIILSTDNKMTPVIPTVDDESIESSLVQKEIIEFQVLAGCRTLLPVIVGSSKFELIWEFSSTPKDVGFGIAYKDDEEKSDDDVQTSIPLSRYISHKQAVHGRMNIEKPGVFYLIFNNAYSRMTAKFINCSVGLVRCKQ